MKKYFIFIFLAFSALHLSAQITTTTLSAAQLPKTLSIKGNLIKGLKWNDKNGENWLILTQTGAFKSKNQNADNTDIINYDTELYAYLFIKTGSSFKQVWRVTDFVRECPLDMKADFVPDAIEVTDLDKNGLAESWLLYRTYCKSDVSPSTQKLIMYENTKKYAIRGETKIKMGSEMYGGQINIDDNFKLGNKIFMNFAKQKWEKFAYEINQD
jgi:hypothetical protein